MNGLYDWLLASAAGAEPVERLQLGLSWTLAEVDEPSVSPSVRVRCRAP